jgi:hypothetical protein
MGSVVTGGAVADLIQRPSFLAHIAPETAAARLRADVGR